MEQKILMNVPEAAELMLIKPNTIRVWLHKNEVIPQELLVRLGRRVFFHKEKLIDWVNAGCPIALDSKK